MRFLSAESIVRLYAATLHRLKNGGAVREAPYRNLLFHHRGKTPGKTPGVGQNQTCCKWRALLELQDSLCSRTGKESCGFVGKNELPVHFWFSGQCQRVPSVAGCGGFQHFEARSPECHRQSLRREVRQVCPMKSPRASGQRRS